MRRGLLMAVASAAAGVCLLVPEMGRSSTLARASAGTVDIYSSVPLHSAQGRAVANGIQLAPDQAGGSAGEFSVDYRALDAGTFAAATANARRAAQDPLAVYYIGELSSAASALSIPILNGAGIAQVSPSSTYAGLTAQDPADAPGEPAKYFPTGMRTFLRLVPPDRFQAAALLRTMARDRCGRVAVANDGQLYGRGVGKSLVREGSRFGIKVTSNTATPSFGSYPRRVKRERARCFLFAGNISTGASGSPARLPRAYPPPSCTAAIAILESASHRARIRGWSTASRFEAAYRRRLSGCVPSRL